eukprot:5303471-Pyramimonas_sp.AAC.1
MEGASFSECGSRFSVAHTCCSSCDSFRDGGRLIFKTWFSPQCRANSFSRAYRSFKDSHC